MTQPPDPRQPRYIPDDRYQPPQGPPGPPPGGGWGGPPPPPGGPLTPPQGPPPKKKRTGLKIFFASAATFVLVLIVASAALSHHSNGTPAASSSSSPAASGAAAPAGAAAAPSPAPSLQVPTQVEFIVSGYAPGDGFGSGPTVNYGSDGNTHEARPASIDGTLTYSIPFDPSAQYYSVNAQLIGSGQLSCKIVVTGPYPDNPLTVSSGNASGGYSICSAQAAPTDSTGFNWRNEQ